MSASSFLITNEGYKFHRGIINDDLICTRLLKLKPFEDFVGDEPVINYVGLRADEDRIGYISHKTNIKTVYPFREDGLVKADVIRILEESGLHIHNGDELAQVVIFAFINRKLNGWD